MTSSLLESSPSRRKAVLDTCAVFEDQTWREEMKERVQAWLGDDGLAVLPGRVITEIARVAADMMLWGADEATQAQQRATYALRNPADLVGLDRARARRAVLTRTDIDALCRDNADLDLVHEVRKDERWVCVPGDADFEIAHTVRVLTAAAHEAVLVTRDRDLRSAADRLGIALLGRRCPPAREAADAPAGGDPLPQPGSGRTVHLLGLNAVVELLGGGLPRLGADGDTAVVLSSTLVRAAQRAALAVPRDGDGRPVERELGEVQRRLRQLLTTGQVAREQARVHVWATPWEVYRLAAERIIDPRFAWDGVNHGALDMHTLLVLSAAQVLGDDGHRVALVDSTRREGEAFVFSGARAWRSAGALRDLAGLVRHPSGSTSLRDEYLPSQDGELDLAALLAKYGRS
ncbi:hypothetical protein [Geodermatophilus sp. SYSU D00815]